MGFGDIFNEVSAVMLVLRRNPWIVNKYERICVSCWMPQSRNAFAQVDDENDVKRC
jgi:hypothetical protein